MCTDCGEEHDGRRAGGDHEDGRGTFCRLRICTACSVAKVHLAKVWVQLAHAILYIEGGNGTYSKWLDILVSALLSHTIDALRK